MSEDASIQYALSEVNEDARREGDTETYMRIMGAGISPRISGLARKFGG